MATRPSCKRQEPCSHPLPTRPRTICVAWRASPRAPTECSLQNHPSHRSGRGYCRERGSSPASWRRHPSGAARRRCIRTMAGSRALVCAFLVAFPPLCTVCTQHKSISDLAGRQFHMGHAVLSNSKCPRTIGARGRVNTQGVDWVTPSDAHRQPGTRPLNRHTPGREVACYLLLFRSGVPSSLALQSLFPCLRALSLVSMGEGKRAGGRGLGSSDVKDVLTHRR